MMTREQSNGLMKVVGTAEWLSNDQRRLPVTGEYALMDA